MRVTKFKSRIFLIFNLILLSSFTMGFRLIPGVGHWDISKDDPTLWIDVCSEPDIDENDLPGNDRLSGESDLTFDRVMETIIDDFNSIDASYLRLAMYPDDPDNPGTPDDGDSTFTSDKASKRTIDLCLKDMQATRAGEASPETEGRKTVACQIDLNNVIAESAKELVATITHEIGHCLGLGHDMETARSVMSYHSDATRLTLDDKMGIIYMYPLKSSYNQELHTFGLSCSTR